MSAYYTTKEKCDGTCATGDWIDFSYDDEAEAIKKIQTAMDNSYAKLENCILLAGVTEGEYGTQDNGEVRIKNAEVLLIGL